LTIGGEPPILTLLTILEFPPSTQVEVKVLVKSSRTGEPLPGKTVTLTVKPVPEANYGGITKSASSGSDGVAVIVITTPPSSLYTYDATITCEGATLSEKLRVLPQIFVRTVEFNYEQSYKPGDYDFVYSGQTVDKETGILISDCALSSKKLEDEFGNVISSEYIYYTSSGGAFTFKARVFDYFASKDPKFNYQQKL